MPSNSSLENATLTYDERCPILQVYLDVFYIYMYAIGPVTVIGLVCNVITILVLQSQKTKVNSLFLLELLAFSDLVFLLNCFIYFPVRHLYALIVQGDEIFRRWDLDVGPWIFTITLPIYFAAQQNRNWLVVIITIERFLNLVFPLWARAALTKTRLKYAFATNVFISIGCNIFYYWVYPIVPNINPCTGEPEMTVIWHPRGREYDNWLNTVMTAMVPLILLAFMNITLIHVLRKVAKNRSQLQGKEAENAQAQLQATLMVVGITVVFLVCETPTLLDRVVMIAGVELSEDDPFRNYARKIGLFLVVLDSAVNFLIYCVGNRPFRRGMFKLLGCGGKDKTVKT